MNPNRLPFCYLRYIEPIYRTRKNAPGAILDFAILGLLKGQNLHGYEVRRRLGEILGPIGRLSFGSLYPALNRMEKVGAVTVLAVTESRTGLTTSRGRKVYSITPEGEALFEEQLTNEGSTDDDKAFAFRLAFAQHLSTEARMRLLIRRRELLTARARDANDSLEARTQTLDTYSRSLMEHTAEVAQNDIAWIDRLIAREQQAVSPNTFTPNKEFK